MNINLNELIHNNLNLNGVSIQNFKLQLGLSNNEYKYLFEDNKIDTNSLLFLSQYFKKNLFYIYSNLYFNKKRINSFCFHKNEYTKNDLIKKYYSNTISLQEIQEVLGISPKILNISHEKTTTENCITKKIHIGRIIKFFCLHSGLSIVELSDLMKKSIKDILEDFNKKTMNYEEVLFWSLTLHINLFEILSLHFESLIQTNKRFRIKFKKI